ncbi:MAG: DUF1501 domain-containing protein [Phycisphaerae bacterium]|jgi:uncharacterized protein (DUF1501 family)
MDCPQCGRDELARRMTRRWFFHECGVGLGSIALAHLLNGKELYAAGPAPAGGNPLAPRPSHFPARARNVIYLFMAGGPSQLDLFDYKPKLQQLDGQPIPPSVVKDQRYAFIERNASILAPRFRFARHGQSGAELSEALPETAKVADDIAIIRSMTTDAFNHAPAQIFMNTGTQLLGRPSMGAWVTYGLGSECDDLPGFIVLNSGGGTSGGAGNWGCGFLPTAYQGVVLRGQGDPILYLSNPPGVSAETRRAQLDALRDLNAHRLDVTGDPEIATRIAAYEMSYKMQSSAPELIDLSKESKETLAMYGVEADKPSFARNCLLARRLVERGVRFIQLYHEAWDHHSDVAGGCKAQCGQTDKACAALVKDLKQRGLLDSTLVVWGGEFGRTPMVETNPSIGRALGRDHHPQAFTMWLAGGGVKGGQTIGATDDLGFHIVEDKVHVHDLQATILHLLGLDHTRLTYRFQGREFRLTDVFGEVVKKLIA